MFGDKWSSAFFGRAAPLYAFFIGVKCMLMNQNRLKNLSIVHAVVLDLSTALEEDVGNGCRDYDKVMVLSGCYTIIDYTANLIAALGMIDDDSEVVVRSDHYLATPELMKELAVELENNLQDDRCPVAIDYKKVQALAALRSLIPHIVRLTELI